MKKRCFSCGASFELSGSGKRQKYCQNCSSRGVQRGCGLPASNTLKSKGAGKHFSAPLPLSVREQIEASKDWPNPIRFITPDGREGRVWLASDKHGNKIIGDDRHWRVHVAEAIKIAAEEARERKAKRSQFSLPIGLMGGNVRGKTDPQRAKVALAILDTELAPPLKGFTARLIFEDEAPAIGSGRLLVLVQFRGKKVILHGDGYTATIRRDGFKELVASNKRRRKRNPVKIDRLPADQPQAVPIGTYPEIITTNFTEVLKGDDITIGTYPDGYPIMPPCLRREPLLRLVVNNPPADTSKEDAA